MSDEINVVTMPKLGETVTEGTIGSWLKNVGDTVEFDDPLFEVSTDKVDSEIPSPYDGVILEILVPAGETVPVGTEVVKIGAPGASLDSAPASPAAAPAAEAAPAAAAPAPAAGGSGFAGAVHDLTMPKLGETVAEGTIGAWLKNAGDSIEFDDPLLEVSTDKVDSEIPSPYDGVLLEILVPAGETVPIGTVIARIGEPGAEGAAAAAPAAAPSAPAATGAAPAAGDGKPAAAGGAGVMLSPLVRRLAAEHNLDVSQISGTGAGGRVRREDVEQAIASGGAKAAPAAAAPAAAAAAPAAKPAAAAAPAASGGFVATQVPGTNDPRDRTEKLSRMRQAVGNGMLNSRALAPQVWASIEVDYENIENVRKKYKNEFRAQTGAGLSYLVFIARAVCEILHKYPAVNSSLDWEAKTQTFHPYVNLGIAVDMDEQGLVVPVINDADQLNLRGIATQIKAKAGLARGKKLGADQMRGSTFTITNPGPVESYASSPIINQPNSGILCTDGVHRKPVAVGDTIAIHHIGIIGLVYDHRSFDGVTTGKFLLDLRNVLQDRDWEAELGL
ncbi:2-oxoglutarate dehydrogenase, E2 component, dihydrolipoamide succinyltransferase [Granulicoccus phenolivorans]|uniref:2-oxoglutarate dehydrogenase, E2 component, dihydrolipoamide succinyltransferase n=1 Tax=Granulicoccus phenolivorans TaxID=266854 RepID=UPI00040B8E07|nr:2-oxoglutarate dehydrogenase, E2 component, dihydrolipoamide succinyltransferase [Granulicoccus phenolivorans]